MGRFASTYARAASAVVLPLLIWVFFSTVYADVLWEKFGESPRGPWLGAAWVGLLVFLEWRWLRVLWDLIHVRGRTDAFLLLRGSGTWIARRRRKRFQWTIVLTSTLFAFAAAEAFFRLCDIRPPPLPRPAVDYRRAVNNTLNAWGLREPWNTLSEEDHRLRIVFLGDSIVYGDGVEREETFCYLLEELLAPSRPAGVRTINMGFWGTAPARQLERYLALRELIRPDVVVHVVYPNDVGLYIHQQLEDIHRIRDDQLWVGERSYVLRYAERNIRYWAAWKRTIDYFRGGRNSEERRQAWAIFKKDVRACQDAVEQGGAEYALALFPWLVRLDGYVLGDVHDTMREFASELGAPYLDLLEVFAGRDAETLRVSLLNEHPNALGHRMAAERIARFMRDEVLPLLDR